MILDKLVTSRMGATVRVTEIDAWDNTVLVDIGGQWFGVQDIKELRKFLKKLQKQLESIPS